MIKKIDSFVLGSKNAKKLAAFYQKKVGVKFQFEGEMGEGKSVFNASWKGSSDFMVMDQKPARHVVNFEVDNIEKEFKRMKKAGVKVVSPIYHIEGYGYVATFADIDGNHFQIVQVRA